MLDKTSCVWPYLSDGRVSSSHLAGAVRLLLMGNLDIGGPLVQEATGGVEATVSDASLSLKVLAHPIAIIVVALARLLCGWKEESFKYIVICASVTFYVKSGLSTANVHWSDVSLTLLFFMSSLFSYIAKQVRFDEPLLLTLFPFPYPFL